MKRGKKSCKEEVRSIQCLQEDCKGHLSNYANTVGYIFFWGRIVGYIWGRIVGYIFFFFGGGGMYYRGIAADGRFQYKMKGYIFL